MKVFVNVSAARMIITTLLILVIFGIIIGAGIPFTVDNYDPGHSVLEIGGPNYYFVEGEAIIGEKFLSLEIPIDVDHIGKFAITTGNDPTLVVHENKVEIPIGNEFCIGGTNPENCTSSLGDTQTIRWDKWVEGRCGGGSGYMLCNSGWIQVGGGHWTSSSSNEPSLVRCARVDPDFDTTNAIFYSNTGCSEFKTSADPYGP